jgi:hypothetical protein
LSEFGKLGMTAIADTSEEADAIYQRTLQVLDREARRGRRLQPGSAIYSQE